MLDFAKVEILLLRGSVNVAGKHIRIITLIMTLNTSPPSLSLSLDELAMSTKFPAIAT